MDILKEKKFLIQEVDNENYVFYNSIVHYACRLNFATLNVLNLIYKYKNLDYILENIDFKHHALIKDIYTKVESSKMLSLEDTSDKSNFLNSSQIPNQYYLHLTYKCNLGCTYCYNKDIRTHFESLDILDWFKIIDKIGHHAKHIVLTGGEPFLFENMGRLVDYIKLNYQDVSIEVISNCMHDFESGIFDNILACLNVISFSCDNLTKENQERKNFQPERFIRNIKYIRTKHPLLHIGISSTFIKNSEGVLDELAIFAKSNDCRSTSILVIPNNESEKHLLPSVSDYEKRLNQYIPYNKLKVKKEFCGAGFGMCSIDPLGNVYPCQNMHYDVFHLGSLTETTIENLFSTDKVRKKRADLSVENVPKCKDCNIKYICGAGCRAATFRLEKNALNYPETLCEYYRSEANSKLLNIPL